MARDGWSIEVREAKGMALPAWYMEGEPQLFFGSHIYIEAFWELCSDRQFGQVVGPLPWSSIRRYARDLGLDYIMTRVFHRVLREMDDEYDKYNKGEQNKRIREREAAQKANQEKQ